MDILTMLALGVGSTSGLAALGIMGLNRLQNGADDRRGAEVNRRQALQLAAAEPARKAAGLGTFTLR